MKHVILIAITFLLSIMEMYSQTFTTQMNGGEKLFFSITDSTKRKVEIIRIKTLNGVPVALPSGNLEIPATVKYKGATYYVTSISEGAFAGADKLIAVSIPSSVGQIGERAFSGCLKLTDIVFPSCKPKIGDSAFEKCSALSSISFGSDWTTMDLHLFADSDSLKTVFVPARVMKITGVKRLPNLQTINVDSSNKAFSSHDGMLYSQDGRTFYACPRARRGDVALKPGTEKVLDGAFKGCTLVESVSLPASAHEFAYDEFDGCKRLTSIVLMSEVPPVTAKWNGSTVFAIESPGENCNVFVPKENRARYQAAICCADGFYETLSGSRKVEAGESEMMGKSTIRRIKRQR